MSRLCPRCGALHDADDARYCSCTSSGRLTATEAGREAARVAMHRRQEIITRGDILHAIDAVMRVRGGNVGDHNDADMELLRALREAFE